ncbi:MAG: hypothetical protein ISR65_03630 [Bacteriovoracaceae bacterium]|nr:hypothetical protein [Bacteriovoracaceae bacterium]
MIYLVVLIIAFTGIFALYFLWAGYRLKQWKGKYSPINYAQNYDAITSSYQFLSFASKAPFNPDDLQYDKQNNLWKSSMLECADKMKAGGVTDVLFVHGTFVGDDPFDIVHLIHSVIPALGDTASNYLKAGIKNSNNLWAKDLGNFTSEYLSLFKEATQNYFLVDSFDWSGANHHLARLKASVDLVKKISSLINNSSGAQKKFLIIGHSHAGALFALLTQALSSKRCMNNFINVLNKAGHDISKLREDIALMSHHKYDIVTLGTPPRYPFAISHQIRILHMINHRGEKPIGGSLLGVLNTRDGDYIQQWGIAGSDIISALGIDRQLNGELVSCLGEGADLNFWMQNMKHQRRLHDQGHHLLIDYKNSSSIPNCLLTIFGHGVYTKYNSMLFNTQQITNHFY